MHIIMLLWLVMLYATVAIGQPIEPASNLLRNSHFWHSANGEVPDWWGTSAPERIREWKGCISFSDDSPIPGVRSLRLFNPQGDIHTGLQSYAYSLPWGEPYTFSVYIRSESGEIPVRLSIGYDKSTLIRATPNWQRFIFTAVPERGHWARGRLIVSISFSNRGAILIAAPQLEKGNEATDYTPIYRDDAFFRSSKRFRAIVQFDAYINEPIMRLWCESRLPQKVRVRCRINELTLSQIDDAVISQNECKFIGFNIDKVQVGAHLLTIEAVDENGETVATLTDTLTKLPERNGIGCAVQIDRIRRHILINGKPKILFAQGIHANPQNWWLDDIAKHGFNTIIPSIPTDQDGLKRARQLLDEAYRRNLYCIAWLRPPTNQPASEIANAIAKAIFALRDHPAIVTWYLLDEPEGWWSQGGRKEGELISVYKAAKASDPYRPAQLNWYSWTDGKGGYGSLQASDFGSLDHYPFGRYENPFVRLSDFLWRMNRDCRPLGKPVAFWQQMYGYDDAVREPTPQEARAHTWLTIVTGGRLIYWFIYKPMSEKLWEAMVQIAEDVRYLEKLLTADDAAEIAVGRDNNVYYTVWSKEGGFILLLANAGYSAAHVPIFVKWLIGKEIKQVRNLRGEGEVSLRDSVIMAQLPPLGAGAFWLE